MFKIFHEFSFFDLKQLFFGPLMILSKISKSFKSQKFSFFYGGLPKRDPVSSGQSWVFGPYTVSTTVTRMTVILPSTSSTLRNVHFDLNFKKVQKSRKNGNSNIKNFLSSNGSKLCKFCVICTRYFV